MLKKPISLSFFFLLCFSLLFSSAFSAITTVPDPTKQTTSVTTVSTTPSQSTQQTGDVPIGKVYVTYNQGQKTGTIWKFENAGEWVTFQNTVKNGEYFEVENTEKAKTLIGNLQNNEAPGVSSSKNDEYTKYRDFITGEQKDITYTDPDLFLAIGKSGEITTKGYSRLITEREYVIQEIASLETQKKEALSKDPTAETKNFDDNIANLQKKQEGLEEMFGNLPINEYSKFIEAINGISNPEMKTAILQAQEDAFAKRECGEGTFSFFCKLTKDFDLESQRERIFLEDVNKLRQNFQIGAPYSDLSQGSELNTIRVNLDKLQAQLETCQGNACDSIKKNLDTTREAYQKAYNQEVLVHAIESFPSAIQDEVKRVCDENTGANDCDSKFAKSVYCGELENKESCEQVSKQLKLADSASLVQKNLFAEISSLLFEPDGAALGALSLFGIEADYSYLPSFLREDFASQICLAKIGGYLDKEVKSAGGVSLYDTEEFNRNIEAFADLRAQRTAITPDNRVEISYSAFLKNQEDKALEYILAVSFNQNGIRQKVSLFDEPKGLGEGGRATEFDTISLPLNNTENIDPYSFTIHLLAVFADTEDIVVNLDYPIILITGGDIIASNSGTVLGNSQGNVQAQQNANTESLSTDSLLSLLR